MYVPPLTPLHLIVSAGSGFHSPFPIQVDMLEITSEYLGKGQSNVTLFPGIAGSVYPKPLTFSSS